MGELDFTSNVLKIPTFAYFLLSLLVPVEYALILFIKDVSQNIIVSGGSLINRMEGFYFVIDPEWQWSQFSFSIKVSEKVEEEATVDFQ